MNMHDEGDNDNIMYYIEFVFAGWFASFFFQIILVHACI